MTNQETTINEGHDKISAVKLTELVNDRELKVVEFYDHTKASERFVIVSVFHNGSAREWYLPYYYRRTNVRIDSIAELCKFILECKPLLTEAVISAFRAEINDQLGTIFGKNSNVTLPIFKKLLENCGNWVWNKEFVSSNPQRRIQDIKEIGFTLATKTENKKTYHMLLPFPIVKAPTYETIPQKIRKAIFSALNGIDAYSGKQATISVLPDHKFPEIRWEESTAESNEHLTPELMRDKFQLVPETINQAKREVCRKCFQTGIRGKLSNINYFYRGNENWPRNIPTTGKAAKLGCVGCFWYDMMEWRKSLNELLENSHENR